jgi:acetolactate synthase small subunit
MSCSGKRIFVIATRNRADVLSRVVMLFHRSAVDIEAIRMTSRGKRANLKITIVVDGDSPNSHRMPAVLDKAVDVLFVETITREGRVPR